MKTAFNRNPLGYALSAAAVLALLACAKASAGTIDLGAANGYTVIDFGTSSTATGIYTQNGGATVNGNVAVGAYASLNISNGGKINGTATYDTATSSITATAGSISGGTTTATTAFMQTIDSAANTASTTYGALTATQTFTSITGATTITGTGGQNVIDVGTINLGNGNHLTLNGNGSGNDTFIIDITGGANAQAFTIGGGASIVLGSGVSANQVLFNIVGSNAGVTIGNGATTYGTFLDVDGGITVTSGTIHDNFISGGTVSLSGGATIDGLPAPVTAPVPAAAWMGLVTMGGLLGVVALRRRATVA